MASDDDHFFGGPIDALLEVLSIPPPSRWVELVDFRKLLRTVRGGRFGGGGGSGSGEQPNSWVVKTLFVSATTLLNTTVVICLIIFWLLNRQVKVRKKKEKPPRRWERKVRRRSESRTRRSSPFWDEDEETMQKMLNQYETDDEDDNSSGEEKKASDAAPDVRKTFSQESKFQRRQSQRYLMDVVSKVEVFSYLGNEAVREVMGYMEYVDVPLGGVLFDETNPLDGSLYAVISGRVMVRCNLPSPPGRGENGNGITDDEPLSFTAGPGDVVTSLLAMLSGLVRHRETLDGLSASSLPGGVADGVSALAIEPNTRLIKVPVSCFTVVLTKYPSDVHRIAQTIVARMYRVTMQTVVKSLGLHLEMQAVETAWTDTPVEGAEWTRLTQRIGGGGDAGDKECEGEREVVEEENWWQKLIGGQRQKEEQQPRRLSADSTQSETDEDDVDVDAVLRDASLVAASQLGFQSSLDDEDAKAGAAKRIRETSQIVSVPPNGVLVQSGTHPNAVFLVLSGELAVGMNKSKTSKSEDGGGNVKTSGSFTEFHRCKPGHLTGLLSCFSGDVSILAVQNGSDTEECVVLQIPRSTFDSLVSTNPRAMLKCLSFILKVVSPIVFLLDWNLEWKHVRPGEVLVKGGEACDSMFVVLNGRLRAGTDDRLAAHLSASPSSAGGQTTDRNKEEYGRGTTIGEVEVLTGTDWAEDVYAIRNSELARMPGSVLRAIMKMYPQTGLHFANVIARQVVQRYGRRRGGLGGGGPAGGRDDDPRGPGKAPPPRSAFEPTTIQSSLPSYGLSLATVAVVPLSDDVDTGAFCDILSAELSTMAPTKLMTKSTARSLIGDNVFRTRNAMHDIKMTRLLGDMEENNRLVLYQADARYTWWTRLCVQQADCVLLVVRAERTPEERTVERCLVWAYKSIRVRVELVVLAPRNKNRQESDDSDDATHDELMDWVEDRPWISGHHLVRRPLLPHALDVRRMCRRIAGQSVGLVLGGGGARGMAHVGVIRALEEAGVTVDRVGGTSQGAFIGALYAKTPDNYDVLYSDAKKMAETMASIREKLLDLTLPLTSIFAGNRFNKGIRKSFGNLRIQELVLNFFCVSTDMCKPGQVVHTRGLCWKYIRASMSLQGYLPPISEDGMVLLDGGYVNVLPADVMVNQMGARTVIAVDVASERKTDYFEYGTSLNGWWLLWNSWNPFVQTVKVPSMGDISNRLAWVSSDWHKTNMIENGVDLYLRPPVDDYATLDFDKMDEIVETGYEYAKPIVEEWVRNNPWVTSEKGE